MEVMEILPKELIFRFLIASDMGRRPKYSWQLLLFIINSPNRQNSRKERHREADTPGDIFFGAVLAITRTSCVASAPTFSLRHRVCCPNSAIDRLWSYISGDILDRRAVVTGGSLRGLIRMLPWYVTPVRSVLSASDVTWSELPMF